MNMAQRDLAMLDLERQFKDIFTISRAGGDNQAERMRAQGFIHAIELLQLCTRDEVQQLMERVHQQVFGCSIAERVPSKQALRQRALHLGDYHYFDEPALYRQQD